MSTRIDPPNEDEPCAYCDSRIFDHDPICVRDCADNCGSPAYFCNYACLSAYIDANDLTAGNACEWSPSDERDGIDHRERAISETPTTRRMSGHAGSNCPECGGQLETEDGMTYRCRNCGREFDSADVFLL